MDLPIQLTKKQKLMQKLLMRVGKISAATT